MKRFFGKLLENKVKNSLDNSDSSLSPLFKYILFGSTGFSFFIILIVVITVIFIPVFFSESIFNSSAAVTDDYCGSLCDDADKKVYKKLEDVKESYKNRGVTIDSNLITGTIFYGRTFNSGIIDDDSDELVDDYKVHVSDVKKLASNMVSGNSLDYAKYREYLVDTYIPKRFSDLYSSDVRKEEIADEIMGYASYSDGDLANCNVINASCSGITIDSGQYAGTYTLEEYVAGVVSHEVGEGWPDEALKAQAIAARTFALNYTNNCTKSIGNSTNVQTFSPTTNERLINAANETAGMVLTYDNKVFSTEYASWWGNNSGSSCGGYNSCSNGQCSIDLVKLPNKEKWSFTMPQNYFAWGAVNDTIQMNDSTIHSLGGHCRGMSQFGAKYLALGENYSYDKILNTFYSPGVELSTFGNNVNSCSSGSSSTGLIASNYKGFLQRVAGPTASDYYYSQEYFYSGNVGQCVWYVQRRALEIINTVEIDEDVRQKAIKALMNTGGNGRDWWNNPSLTMFGSSTDYSKPKVGSIIVWRYTPSRIASMGADYGHVGIVEAVDYENGTMTVSDGWKPNWGNPNTLSSAAFGFRTVPFEWALNYGNPNSYIFMGYVYLLD